MNILKKGIFGFKHILAQLREELDEHLSAINENTDEIQANYSYIHEVDNKIEQLANRLDRIEMLLDGQHKQLPIQPLTYTEKQVFLALYTEEVPLNHTDIAKRTGYSEPLVKQYTNALVEKGIPILKSYFNNISFLKLDPEFKELQAKENILNLSLKSFVEN